MAHHATPSGIVGWGPTAAELDHLASLFDGVRHVAFLHKVPAPMSSIPYRARNITLVPVSPTGGTRLSDKVDVLRKLPSYARTIWRELNEADVVNVRCPANISMLALVLLLVRRSPRVRWVKYAGNWNPGIRESWSYRFQRWFLRNNFHRGLVTVNGAWPQQGQHIRPFLNPSLEEEDLQEGREAAPHKLLAGTIHIVFAGRLEEAKGVGRALEILARLKARGIPAHLHIFGDGPDREHFHSQAAKLQLAGLFTFYGAQARQEVFESLRLAHFVVLPSASSEGWPKILSEGMCFGAIPLAGAVSTIPADLTRFNVGKALHPHDVDGFADAIVGYWNDPDVWALESHRGVTIAGRFSFARYREEVRSLIEG